MSRTIFLPASIPLANPNRLVPERTRASNSVISCFSNLNTNSPSNSAVYTRPNSTTDSPGKLCSSSVSAIPLIPVLQRRPSPDLGLASVLFVLSTVFGAFVSLGLVSIPAMFALRKFGISASRLEKVVAQEVPGTLLSLKLSSLEISRITQILSSVRRALTVESGSRSIDNNLKQKV